MDHPDGSRRVAGARTGRPRLRRRAEPTPGPVLDGVVTSILGRTDLPLSAYDLVGKLREAGITVGVMSVYRSLDRLRADGVAEKVETLSAFRRCDGPHGALMICTDCGRTHSVPVPDVWGVIERAIGATGFAPGHMSIEVTGRCERCDGRGDIRPEI